MVALVTAVLERADGQGRPAYLMTSRPELVGYYRSFGFDSIGQLSLPRGVTAWQMLRDPE